MQILVKNCNKSSTINKNLLTCNNIVIKIHNYIDTLYSKNLIILLS
jgi:hypothetical protein